MIDIISNYTRAILLSIMIALLYLTIKQTDETMAHYLHLHGPQAKTVFMDEYLQSIFHFLFFIFCFLGPHLWHMEVPRLGVE